MNLNSDLSPSTVPDLANALVTERDKSRQVQKSCGNSHMCHIQVFNQVLCSSFRVLLASVCVCILSSGLCPFSLLQGVNFSVLHRNLCIHVCDFPCQFCTYQCVHWVQYLLPLRRHIIRRFWGFRWDNIQHSSFPVTCLCIQVPGTYLLKGRNAFERSLCDRWHPHTNTNTY